MKNILKTIINIILAIIGIIINILFYLTLLAIPISLILFICKIFELLSITWLIVISPVIIAGGLWLSAFMIALFIALIDYK